MVVVDGYFFERLCEAKEKTYYLAYKGSPEYNSKVYKEFLGILSVFNSEAMAVLIRNFADYESEKYKELRISAKKLLNKLKENDNGR